VTVTPDVVIVPIGLVCGEATAAAAEEYHPDIEQILGLGVGLATTASVAASSSAAACASAGILQ
jgi:hypothetical protein